MKTWYGACILMTLLLLATPLFAQEADLDDENMLLVVADMGAQDPPDNAAAAQGESPHAGMMMDHKMNHEGMMGKHEGMDMHHHGRWGGMAAFLNLSKEQIAKMRALHERYYEETRNLRYDLMQKRLETRRLFLDPKADGTAILAKQRELSALRQKMMDAMGHMMVEWRAILTPEQIKKLDMAALSRSSMGRGMMKEGMMGHSMMESGHGMMGHGMEGCDMCGGMGRGMEGGMMGHGMEGHHMMGDGE